MAATAEPKGLAKATRLSHLGRTQATMIAAAEKALVLVCESESFDELDGFEALGEMLRTCAQEAGQSVVIANKGAELMLRSRRRRGKLFEALKLRSVGRPEKNRGGTPAFSLDDFGISRDDYRRDKQIASVADEEFESHLETEKIAGRDLTTIGVLKLAKKSDGKKASEVSHAAALSHGIVQNLSELISAGAKFSTIYADPPWRYDNKATRSNVDSAAEYKGTMSIDEICAEPVSEIVTEQAHLHLWTTNAFLFDARKVMEAWGFEYKSCFVWVKPQMGIGNYWRVSHEFMLLGVRGGLRFADKGQKSWLEHNRGKHSQKPHIIRNTIQKVSPGPYLEMYGRHIVDGWTVYGNQIIGTAQREFTIQQDLF